MVQFSALCHPVTTSICPQLHHMGCFEIFMIWLVLSSSFGCLVPTLPQAAHSFSYKKTPKLLEISPPAEVQAFAWSWVQANQTVTIMVENVNYKKNIYIYRKHWHLCFQCWRASNLFFTRTLWFLFCKNPIISGGWRLTKPNSNQVPRKKESRKVVQNRSLPHALVNSL